MTDEVGLPTARLREAGATDAEIAILEDRFYTSDVLVQRSWADSLRAEARAALRVYLEELREDGYFTQEPTSEPERPQAATEAPERTDDTSAGTDEAPGTAEAAESD